MRMLMFHSDTADLSVFVSFKIDILVIKMSCVIYEKSATRVFLHDAAGRVVYTNL